MNMEDSFLKRLVDAVEEMMESENDIGCSDNLTVADRSKVLAVEGIAGKIKDDLRMEKYIKAKGVMCPCCRSMDIDSGILRQHEHGSEFISQSCRCGNCNAKWEDQYSLTAAYFDDEE